MGWLFVLVMGIIIGFLGKFVAPAARTTSPLWLTVVCGIVGVVIGYGWLRGHQGHRLDRLLHLHRPRGGPRGHRGQRDRTTYQGLSRIHP